MYKLFFFYTFLLLFSFSKNVNANSIEIDHRIMEDMIKKANEEGKMILLEFYADWSVPCRWMQETVFQDTEVNTILSKGFITKMINIDDVKGYELKRLYDVIAIPTILIFNSKGKMIERIEKTITTGELVEVLELHNNHRNEVKIKHSINSSPIANDPESKASNKFQENYLKYVESNENSLRNYRLQMGIFENFENAFDKVQKLKTTFLEPIIVVNDFKNEKVRYKVMMGEFQTAQEAESYREILEKDYNLKGLVK